MNEECYKIEICADCEHFYWSCFYCDYICRLNLELAVSPFDKPKKCLLEEEKNK